MASDTDASIVINRPVADVFAYVADFENHPQWENLPMRGPAGRRRRNLSASRRHRRPGRVAGRDGGQPIRPDEHDDVRLRCSREQPGAVRYVDGAATGRTEDAIHRHHGGAIEAVPGCDGVQRGARYSSRRPRYCATSSTRKWRTGSSCQPRAEPRRFTPEPLSHLPPVHDQMRAHPGRTCRGPDPGPAGALSDRPDVNTHFSYHRSGLRRPEPSATSPPAAHPAQPAERPNGRTHDYWVRPSTMSRDITLCPRQDSNLRFRLRRATLYPLSYGGSGTTRSLAGAPEPVPMGSRRAITR